MPSAVRMPVSDPSMNSIMIAPIATRVEPTARSMPPVMMTNVIPSAIMPMVALLRRILIQFLRYFESQSPNEAWSNPSAIVCRTAMRRSAQAVLKSGCSVHIFLNHSTKLNPFFVSSIRLPLLLPIS